MVTYLPRSAWGAREARGSTALVVSDVLNTAFHWPGMAKPIDAAGDVGQRRVASALRGWQNYHMDGRGWSDIAYQIAIDQEGRAWTLRGINIRSGANGDATVNRKYGAILLVLGPGETMSAKMKATSAAVVADYRRRFPKMPVKPTWHGAIRPGGTTCPGPVAVAAIKAGELNASTPKPTPVVEDDVALTDADKTWLRANMDDSESDYAVRFWVAPTGTGTAFINLVKEMKLQLDRIEDDTDTMAASQALITQLDDNLSALQIDAQLKAEAAAVPPPQ